MSLQFLAGPRSSDQGEEGGKEGRASFQERASEHCRGRVISKSGEVRHGTGLVTEATQGLRGEVTLQMPGQGAGPRAGSRGPGFQARAPRFLYPLVLSASI